MHCHLIAFSLKRLVTSSNYPVQIECDWLSGWGTWNMSVLKTRCKQVVRMQCRSMWEFYKAVFRSVSDPYSGRSSIYWTSYTYGIKHKTYSCNRKAICFISKPLRKQNGPVITPHSMYIVCTHLLNLVVVILPTEYRISFSPDPNKDEGTFLIFTFSFCVKSLDSNNRKRSLTHC